MSLYQEALDLFDLTVGFRRDFHRHPELGFNEVRTSRIVADELSRLGYEVQTGLAKTGVVGLIQGEQPGPVALLRFDMDALPVQEDTGAEYASETPGLMHACGHDGHVAIGLTVANLLMRHREAIKGTVKLVFQPAEEGMGGAAKMIEAGILKDPAPDFALGVHVWNERPVGWVCAVPGPVMAGAEIFKIKITGRGGHGAVPHQAVDPVAASAQIITALQTIVSRNVSPLQSGVVSITQIHGGETFNVIPQAVEMAGTIRTFEPEVRKLVLERFNQVVQGVAEAMGCQAEITMQDLTPATINDRWVTERMQERIRKDWPEAELVTQYQTMGSEDMSLILNAVPGCFLLVGSMNAERNLNYAHHHPRFDFDEQVLPHAAALLASAVLEGLGEGQKKK